MEHFILKLYTVFLVRAERSQPGRVSSSDPWALCFWVLWQHSDVAAPWYWGPWARRQRRCHFAHFFVISFVFFCHFARFRKLFFSPCHFARTYSSGTSCQTGLMLFHFKSADCQVAEAFLESSENLFWFVFRCLGGSACVV